MDPLKVLEYLAAGIPVVSTPLPEVRKYEGAVTIAEGVAYPEATLDAVSGSRNRDLQESRRQLARQHTWEQRARTFLSILASQSNLPGVGLGA